MPTDIAIGTANLPTNTPVLRKPVYLITLSDVTVKPITTVYFIAVDQPNFESAFIKVRGIYSNLSEEDIVKKFGEILATAPKDSVLEMMFPAHRVKSIRSLVFNAVKPTMINR